MFAAAALGTEKRPPALAAAPPGPPDSKTGPNIRFVGAWVSHLACAVGKVLVDAAVGERRGGFRRVFWRPAFFWSAVPARALREFAGLAIGLNQLAEPRSARLRISVAKPTSSPAPACTKTSRFLTHEMRLQKPLNLLISNLPKSEGISVHPFAPDFAHSRRWSRSTVSDTSAGCATRSCRWAPST
jgi:hypothetical protein